LFGRSIRSYALHYAPATAKTRLNKVYLISIVRTVLSISEFSGYRIKGHPRAISYTIGIVYLSRGAPTRKKGILDITIGYWLTIWRYSVYPELVSSGTGPSFTF
jgi:hypothetical protein